MYKCSLKLEKSYVLCKIIIASQFANIAKYCDISSLRKWKMFGKSYTFLINIVLYS